MAAVFGPRRGWNDSPALGHGVDTTQHRGLPRLGDPFVGIEASALPPRAPVFLATAPRSARVGVGGGCTLLVAPPPLIRLGVADSGGAVFFPRPIPRLSALRGLRLFDQVLVLDPGHGAWRGLLAFSPGLESLLD